MDEKNALEELRMMSDRLHNEECVQDIVASDLTFVADRIEREWVELPRDKDGVPIHVGDTVYLEDWSKTIVHSIDLMADATNIVCWVRNRGYVPLNQSDLTHEYPDTLERIADELKRYANDSYSEDEIDGMTASTLDEFADRIRKLAKEGK